MYKNVLLPVDLGEPGSWEKALPAALMLCKASGAALHVLTVVPEISAQIASVFPPDAGKKLLEEASGQLHDFVAKRIPKGVNVQAITAQGGVHHEILAAADRSGADCIVMGAHKPGLRDYLLSANAAHVVRHFPGSVLVARG